MKTCITSSLLILIIVLLSSDMKAQSTGVRTGTKTPVEFHDPDWSESAELPLDGDRKNIFQLPEEQWKSVVIRGQIHAAWYPYANTGMLLPIDEFRAQLEKPRFGRPFNSIDDLFQWMNLPKYPESQNASPDFPLMQNPQADYPFQRSVIAGSHIGVTKIQRDDWQGITFSCTACHADQLFGKPVFGLANRYGRGSDFFYFGKMVGRFSELTGIETTTRDSALDREARKMSWVGIKMPPGPGLITSLSQTSLSLSLRRDDDYASMTGKPDEKAYQNNPFSRFDAASKPPALWLAKYKTKWLNDGSQVSGNPVHVNFAWNEIGRGGDLTDLQDWFKQNEKIVNELTAAVFATRSPRITEFFDPGEIDVEQAIAGQILFEKHCARCHGRYEKVWEGVQQADFADYPTNELIRTVQVRYSRKTRVVDVKTDPNRYIGMQTLAPQLNRLKISTDFGIRYQPQTGYVPPPLEGIWARWPYLHNNSVPTLRDILTRSDDRPKVYHAGRAVDRKTDFDIKRVGYPTGDRTPKDWREDSRNRFDTSLPGLSNRGHDEGIFLKQGRELLTDHDKDSIIEYLKTL